MQNKIVYILIGIIVIVLGVVMLGSGSTNEIQDVATNSESTTEEGAEMMDEEVEDTTTPKDATS
jgi:hypothetical protein